MNGTKRKVLFGNPRELTEAELKAIDEQERKDRKRDAALELLQKKNRTKQEDAELSDLTTE